MNCFEARKEFPSFWRRMLTPEERTAFLAHVGRCARCDRAFRVFALTAPVLHGDSESREPLRVEQPSVATYESSSYARREPVIISRRGATVARSAIMPRASRTVWAAAALAAAALFAVYVAAATPGQTLEDAILGEDPVADLSTAASDSGAFGDAVLDQDTLTQDPLTQPNSGANGVAG
jgi:putative zinc finger protein